MGTDRFRLNRRPANRLSFDALGITALKEPEPGAWFLGPHGENLDQMRALWVELLDDHVANRRDFWPDDPPFISKDVQGSQKFKDTMDATRANLKALSRALAGSTPMSSYRNKSHMNWDITMPGALGYAAAMLFNPNNVAAEASPVTTAIELQVGRDLCRMLGYGATGTPEAWGHITCDGSIANTEAMWAARNLRYRGAAIARAIRLDPALRSARGLSVVTADGSYAQLLDLEPWQLLNLPNDTILGLPNRVVGETEVTAADLEAAIEGYDAQTLGMARFHQEVLAGTDMGAVLVPATAHYSWDKGAAILGLGARSLHHIDVDKDARMKIAALRATLDRCLRQQIPVVQLVVVAGSTAESAVDPIADILKLRAEYASKGLSFTLHADAAWGGYFTSMLRPPKDNEGYTPSEPMSAHVTEQLDALRHVDTITVDPHKSGYLPYPAGSLCYRDKRMIHLVAHEAPVVHHEGDAPSVGAYGLEGSKPGAAAAGVALSHATIPPDQSGYGELLGRCIFNAKRFYIGVNTLAEPGDGFFTIPVARLPAERRGAPPEEIEAERELMRTRLRNVSNEELLNRLKDDTLGTLFKEIGPDLTVFAYAFNLIGEDGNPNADPVRMDKLNKAVFDALSIGETAEKDAPPKVPMVLTSTRIDPALYGDEFTDDFCRRAGITRPDGPIRVLISTMQDPWVSDTSTGNFIPELMKILRQAVLDARATTLSAKG